MKLKLLKTYLYLQYTLLVILLLYIAPLGCGYMFWMLGARFEHDNWWQFSALTTFTGLMYSGTALSAWMSIKSTQKLIKQEPLSKLEKAYLWIFPAVSLLLFLCALYFYLID